MKFKWFFPFTPTVTFADPPPNADLPMRAVITFAVLVMVGIWLCVIQPWRKAVSDA